MNRSPFNRPWVDTADPGIRFLIRVFFLAMWLLALAFLIAMLAQYRAQDHIGVDAHAYWNAVREENPYLTPPGYRDSFLYSPAFLQAITPLALLPWYAFLGIWMVSEFACFVWLTQDLAWRWRFPVLILCMSETLYGNIHAFLGVMVCLGLRRPGVWALALLTKVTIGLVGLAWFAARGEWKKLSEVLVVTAGITALSALIAPDTWILWFDLLTTGTDEESHYWRSARLVVVLGLVMFAARRGADWVLPVALLLATPRFSLHVKDLSVLAAIPRLRGRTSTEQPRDT